MFKKIEENKPSEENKEEENKTTEKEKVELKKPKSKKFNNLELVIESSVNTNNEEIITNNENKKDIKNNIKPTFAIQEERTSLCFVSENNPKEENKENIIESNLTKAY